MSIRKKSKVRASDAIKIIARMLTSSIPYLALVVSIVALYVGYSAFALQKISEPTRYTVSIESNPRQTSEQYFFQNFIVSTIEGASPDIGIAAITRHDDDELHVEAIQSLRTTLSKSIGVTIGHEASGFIENHGTDFAYSVTPYKMTSQDEKNYAYGFVFVKTNESTDLWVVIDDGNDERDLQIFGLDFLSESVNDRYPEARDSYVFLLSYLSKFYF